MTWMQIIKTLLDNEFSIFRPSSLTFDRDLWPFIPPSEQNIPTKVQHHWTFLDEVTGQNSILDQDLWPLTSIGSGPKSNQFIYSSVPLCQVWYKSTQEFSRYRGNEVKISFLDQVHWPMTLWVDLTQNLINSSTPHGAPLCQVWWKSTQGFLKFRDNEVKIEYLDQVHWPLTFDSPKI